jgi:hypothetical protein
MRRCSIAVRFAFLALVGACPARPQSTQAQSTQVQSAQVQSVDPHYAQLPPETRELQARQDAANHVDALVKQGDFKALDALATDDRSSHGLTPAGVSRLHLVYGEVSSLVSGAERQTRCASPLADQLTAWAGANLTSAAAVNINAIVLMDRAWCYRGGEFADKVPGRDWAPFEQYVQEARAWLEAHRAVG